MADTTRTRRTTDRSDDRDRREALAWVTTAWRSEQILRALEERPESE